MGPRLKRETDPCREPPDFPFQSPGFRGLEAADVAQLAIAGRRDAEAALEGAGEVVAIILASIRSVFAKSF